MPTSPTPTQSRRPPVALAVFALIAVVVGVPAAASASSTSSQLAQLQAREAAARVQLNVAKADLEVARREVARLDAAVATEEALVAADQSALRAAEARVAGSKQRLAQLAVQGDAARRALVGRAVYLYEHPYMQEQILLDGAKTLDEITSRQVLANAVQGSTNDLIDAVRQQQLLERAASKDLTTAESAAADRAHTAEQEYRVLTTAQNSELQAVTVFSSRVADADAALAADSAQEAKLQAQLNAETARVAGSIADGGAFTPGPIGSYGLVWPIHGVVTQEFGHDGHPGIDIAAGYGTPIHASGSGVVIYAGWESGYGNYTCIAHGGGISTCYGHQSAINVSVGQTVTRGQVIGAEGSTGYSTGPHVHFEVRVNGVVHNPRSFIPGNP